MALHKGDLSTEFQTADPLAAGNRFGEDQIVFRSLNSILFIPNLARIGTTLQDNGLLAPDGGLRTEELKSLSRDQIVGLQTELSRLNLYVPKEHKFYNDGQAGGLTGFALELATDETRADDFIAQTIGSSQPLNEAATMKL